MIKKILIIIFLLIIPFNVFAVSGNMRFEYVIKNRSRIEITLKSVIKSGKLTKYSANLALSDNLTYSEVSNEEGWTITYEDGLLTAVNETGATTSSTIGKLVLNRDPRADWTVTASNSQMCEDDQCVKIYNNKISGSLTSSSEGQIANPATAVFSNVSIIVFVFAGIILFRSVYKKKYFSKI